MCVISLLSIYNLIYMSYRLFVFVSASAFFYLKINKLQENLERFSASFTHMTKDRVAMALCTI